MSTTRARKNGQAGESPPPEPASDTNGNSEAHPAERVPVKVFSYLVGENAYVQASVWERTATRRDGSTFTTYDVSLRKRYKDQRDGQFKSLYTFHGSESYAVIHALDAASAYITELRAGNPDS